MRPAGRAALESLYFTYPRFAPPAGPPRADARVAIVGAGPVGLTAQWRSPAMASRAWSSTARTRSTTAAGRSASRASMHILERAGAVAPFLAKAVGCTHGTSFWRGQVVYRLGDHMAVAAAIEQALKDLPEPDCAISCRADHDPRGRVLVSRAAVIQPAFNLRLSNLPHITSPAAKGSRRGHSNGRQAGRQGP